MLEIDLVQAQHQPIDSVDLLRDQTIALDHRPEEIDLAPVIMVLLAVDLARIGSGTQDPNLAHVTDLEAMGTWVEIMGRRMHFKALV
jgi:hypothetical protein